MPSRAALWLPSETVPEGHVAQLYGPDATGALDTTRIMPAQRAVVNKGDPGTHIGPAAQSPAGSETAALRMETDLLVYGDKQMAVKLVDRETGELSTISDTVSVFVDSTPVPSRRLTCQAAPNGSGLLVFDFNKGVCL